VRGFEAELVETILAAVDSRPRVRDALAGGEPFTAVVALGKAAAAMAAGAVDAGALAAGAWGFVARPRAALPLAATGSGWEEWIGGHPVPDVDSMGAGRRLLFRLADLAPDDRLLALVSGGASACCEVPAGTLSLADLSAADRAMQTAGWPIERVNVVRKRLSALKGGGALAASAAPVTCLVLSDVPGDDPSLVACGPFVPDRATWAEALAAVDGLALPRPVARHLVAGAEAEAVEGAAAEEAAGRDAARVLAGNGTAVDAAGEWLRAAGWRVESGVLDGEAAAAGEALVERGRRLAGERVARVLGGETTVRLGDLDAPGRPPGRRPRGGRNQELALAAAKALAGGPARERVVAFATDGVDGPTPAAGAVVDWGTWERLQAAGAEPAAALAGHRSYEALSRLPGTLLETGPTGTNVADVAVYLRG
jgi:hydroxypyruvate reductase